MLAQADTLSYRVRKFVKRNAAAVVAAAVCAVAITGFAVLAAWQARRASEERDTARARADELVLAHAQGYLSRDPTATLAWLKQYPVDGADLSGARNVAREAVARGVARHVLEGHQRSIFSAEFAAGQRLVVTSGFDKTVQIRDADSGRRVAVVTGTYLAGLDIVAGSPDGRWLAVLRDGGGVLVVDLRAPEAPPRILGAGGAKISGVSFVSTDDLLTFGQDGVLRRWNIGTGQGEVVVRRAGVRRMKIVRGGGAVVLMCRDGAMERLNLATGTLERIADVPMAEARSLAASPDGRRVAFGSEDGRVHLLGAGEERQVLPGHTGAVMFLEFSPDGQRLASASADQTVRVWDLGTGAARVLGGHSADVERVAFSPDGKRLVSASRDRTVRLWDLATGDGRVLEGHAAHLLTAAFAPDGRWVVSASFDGTARVWDATSTDGLPLVGHHMPVERLAFAQDGGWWVTSDASGTVLAWDMASPTPRILLEAKTVMSGLSLSRDGRRLMVATFDGQVRLLAPRGPSSVRVLLRHESTPRLATMSPEGSVVAWTDNSGIVRLTEVASGKTREARGHTGLLRALVFSPDGRWLASAARIAQFGCGNRPRSPGAWPGSTRTRSAA